MSLSSLSSTEAKIEEQVPAEPYYYAPTLPAPAHPTHPVHPTHPPPTAHPYYQAVAWPPPGECHDNEWPIREILVSRLFSSQDASFEVMASSTIVTDGYNLANTRITTLELLCFINFLSTSSVSSTRLPRSAGNGISVRRRFHGATNINTSLPAVSWTSNTHSGA